MELEAATYDVYCTECVTIGVEALRLKYPPATRIPRGVVLARFGAALKRILGDPNHTHAQGGGDGVSTPLINWYVPGDVYVTVLVTHAASGAGKNRWIVHQIDTNEPLVAE